jgi:hypothetical protein
MIYILSWSYEVNWQILLRLVCIISKNLEKVLSNIFVRITRSKKMVFGFYFVWSTWRSDKFSPLEEYFDIYQIPPSACDCFIYGI